MNAYCERFDKIVLQDSNKLIIRKGNRIRIRGYRYIARPPDAVGSRGLYQLLYTVMPAAGADFFEILQIEIESLQKITS